MREQVTVIAFDLDDTLWPCAPTLERAERTLYQWLDECYPRITESLDPQQMAECRYRFSQREPRYRVDLTALRREFLQYLGESYDYDGDQVSRDGFRVFFDARQEVEFFDDVLPCLNRLREQFQIGVISNGNASVEHVGLGQLVEHALSAADLQLAKPDPRIFVALADRFCIPPQQLVYVGDHPEYDVVGAWNAGLQAVWLNREHRLWPAKLPQSGHEIKDLYELIALLGV